MDAILFKQRYDAGRLAADLSAAAEAASWIEKPGKETYFRWSAIPLYSLHGQEGLDAVDLHVSLHLPGDCVPTRFMAGCPYVREILEAIPARKLRVRFMKLEAGGRIGRHRDKLYGWELPILRLHVPVVTHAGVDFRVEGRRIDMRAGELWYVDTSKEHEVDNPGPTDRVHLVIDLVNTAELRERLGPESWQRAFS